MILLKPNKWVVMDTRTREVISEHPFKTDYEQKKAKEAALESNSRWKAKQCPS